MPAKSPAQILLEKADKKANSTSGWFTSSSTKWEEAGDLYQQAANSFKLEKLFREAGECFSKEAECRENCKELNEAANAWWNAAKAFKRGYPDLAIKALSQTITFLTQTGRFRQAADREKEIAQIYLQEQNDLSRACESYLRAGQWYEQEDASSTANACYKDAADLCAEMDDFPRAIDLYEQVAKHSLGSNLTKYSVREYYLKAGLCSLATPQNLSGARNKIATYATQDPDFSTTREYKFLQALSEAAEAGDMEQFTGAVVEFDRITKLDNWKTSILLKIKRGLDVNDWL